MIPETAIKQIEYIKKRCEELKPLVAILCITYNHEKYLREALEGFVMQKTDFPFIAIVHEDASTDSTAEILKEYAEKYPDIIFPIYEEENQYSKKNGTIREILNKASSATDAEFVATCEGDDYWIDPLKLKKQVDFLKKNPEYSMVTSNIYEENREGTKSKSVFNVEYDYDPSMEEVIKNGGSYLSTPTFLYRFSIYHKIPKELFNLPVGDYPLQIYMRHKGKIKILKEHLAVYRVNSIGSWSEKYHKYKKNKVGVIHYIQTGNEMFDVLNRATEMQYNNLFQNQKRYNKFALLYNYSKILGLLFLISNPFKNLKVVNWQKYLKNLSRYKR